MSSSHAIAEQEPKQRLSTDDLTTLGRIIGRDLTAYRSDAADLLDKVSAWRDQYDGTASKPKGAQAWQSNVSIPKTKATVDSIAENVTTALCNISPYTIVEAEDVDDPEAEDGMEDWIQDWNERTRLRSKILLAVREAATTGQAWLKPTVVRTGKPAPMWTGEPLNVTQLDIVPRCEVVITEDMALLPATAPNFSQARGAFSRVYLRWNEIKQALKSKSFYEDSVNNLKAEWMESHPQTKQQEVSGITPEEPDEIWGARFECWEGVYRWCKPGDDEETEWLILAAHRSDSGGDAIILRCSPYSEIYGNQWFFSPVIMKPSANSMWGEPVAETMRGMQAWINATFSQISDAITISILPPMAIPQGQESQYRKYKWGPMERWPVSNPADVRILESSASSLASIGHAANMMGLVREEIERATGVTDYTQGKASTEKRTAFEIGALIEAGSTKFNVQASNVQFGLEEGDGLEGYTRNLVNVLARFLPQVPIRHKVSKRGRTVPKVFNPEWYQYSYKYTPNGSSQSTNPQARLQRAMATRQGIAQSPFTQISPLDSAEQLIDKVKRIWNAENEYYQAMGHRNTEEIIGTEPETFEEAAAIAYTINPAVAQAILVRYAQGLGDGMAQGGLPPAEAGAVGGIGAYEQPALAPAGGPVPGDVVAPGMAPV
ncbi:MAG: hypothetical protein KA354_24925 [Phycisphaerae bacterium]|nr:hypothetical protein [Phycisphaerae bacterium]